MLLSKLNIVDAKINLSLHSFNLERKSKATLLISSSSNICFNTHNDSFVLLLLFNFALIRNRLFSFSRSSSLSSDIIVLLSLSSSSLLSSIRKASPLLISNVSSSLSFLVLSPLILDDVATVELSSFHV